MQFTSIDLLLFLISFLSAAISAATGLGGGIIFLMGLNVFMPLNIVIPIHGLIQLSNNLIRTISLRKHIIWPICLYFLLGASVGLTFCYIVLSSKDLGNIPYIIIFCLVMYSLFKPKKMPELKIKALSFSILGAITGALGPIIGAVDPLLAPFFLRDDFTKENIIANKSFFQSLIHFSKIPFFYFLGFDYLRFFPVIVLLFLGGVLGSFFGLRILHYVNRRAFLIIFKSVLFIVAIKLLLKII
jgi:uncharacterized membrane protein YfcA